MDYTIPGVDDGDEPDNEGDDTDGVQLCSPHIALGGVGVSIALQVKVNLSKRRVTLYNHINNNHAA